MASENCTVTGETQAHITGSTSSGLEFQANILQLTRYVATFELFGPEVVLRVSEVLDNLRITGGDRTVYSGRAVVRSIVDSGSTTLCEITLEDACWQDLAFDPADFQHARLRSEFQTFLGQWQKLYQVRPEFKVVVADMRNFFTDMRFWLQQVELAIRSAPLADRLKLEKSVAAEIGKSTTPAITALFEKFEAALMDVETEQQPAHQAFGRRNLHPELLCSPFLYRTFAKPLGYAGDYEMVNMIMRDPFEGGSLYAKIVNLWFWEQAPAEAHRNRINYLTEQITLQAARAISQGRKARVVTLGCGPGHEVQRFLRESPYAGAVEFTLLDFNPETLAHVENVLNGIKRASPQPVRVNLVKKSVNQVLKESGKTIVRPRNEQFDLVYCAGLFDYLADPICRKLTSVLYDWVAPGGLLITTNVDTSNPRIITMDYIMEWHLIYRSGAQLFDLKPENAPEEVCSVKSDITGVNVYFEAIKPNCV